MEPVVTERGTYIAPFVNGEEAQYLVIEDRFPNGRPRWRRRASISPIGKPWKNQSA